MEAVLQTIGITLLVILALAGGVAGLLAGAISGRNKGLYIVLGIVGAVAMPFVLAALGVTALAAGGVVVILIAGAVGAALLLMLGKLVFDRT